MPNTNKPNQPTCSINSNINIRNQTQFYRDCAQLIVEIINKQNSSTEILKKHFREHPQMGKNDRENLSEFIHNVFRNFGNICNFSEFMAKNSGNKIKILIEYFNNNFGKNTPRLTNPQPQDNGKLKAAEINNPEQNFANLPAWLGEQLINHFGNNALELAQVYQQRAPIDIRINSWKITNKNTVESLINSLKKTIGENWQIENLPHLTYGFRILPNNAKIGELKHNPHLINLTKLPEFVNGFFEIQDYGSQLIVSALPPKISGNLFVDYCAGAGGKTLALLSKLYSQNPNKLNKFLLLACDVNAQKLENLTTRFERTTFPQNSILQNLRLPNPSVSEKYHNRADIVIVDAPCSGLGTLRRAPEIAWRLTPDDINVYTKAQKQILKNASLLVRNGGYLLYATCSWLAQENYQIIQEFLNSHNEFEMGELYLNPQFFQKQEQQIGLAQSFPVNSTLMLTPLTHNTDGFFMAMMRRIK